MGLETLGLETGVRLETRDTSNVFIHCYIFSDPTLANSESSSMASRFARLLSSPEQHDATRGLANKKQHPKIGICAPDVVLV